MTSRPVLTLGPLLFNWPVEEWTDFYARIADEAPVEEVHLGEVVCAKRAPFFAPHLPAVIERLQTAGKRVVLSSPILVTTERERQAVRELADSAGELAVEANDLGAVALLGGRRHRVGPFVNVYNEATLGWLAGRGAEVVCLPGELPLSGIAALARAAAELGTAVEVQVFGRVPLAISARCYHARAHGLHKDNCRFVCGQDLDGMNVVTLDDTPFLAVNGTQTLSHGCLGLVPELAALQAAGVGRFRLSPQHGDMVAVAELFRAVLDGRRDPAAALAALAGLTAPMTLANGFFHDQPGAVLVPA
jgi:collagenase-like PrtC family protease